MRVDFIVFLTSATLIIPICIAVLKNGFFIMTSLGALVISVLIIYLVYALYRAYWQPVTYSKDFIEVGFDHVKGPGRELQIARLQKNRALGFKLPPPYPNGWFAVAESSELEDGGVLSVDALGQNLCVYRGEDGIARCVDAYCPHLGANLSIGGKVCGACIECPFHQWRFGAEGALVGVPGQESVPKGVAIKAWPTVEADGAVWIWHDTEGRSPKWELRSAPELETWKWRGSNVFYVGCHIQEIPENGADVAHLNAVHSTSLLSSLGEKYPFIIKFIGHHHWTAEWKKMEDHTANVRMTHDYKIFKRNLFHLDVDVTQNGPGHVLLRINSSFGPLLLSQSVTPLGPLYQKVVHRVFTPKRNAIVGFFMNLAESSMIKRDIAIWNNKRYMDSPAFVKTDKSIKAFRSWYSQFYSENSISFRDAHNKNVLDW